MWTQVMVVVAVVGGVWGGGGLLYASAPQDRGQYYTGRGGLYSYGYNTGDGTAKVEVKRSDGSVVGSYRYFDPNGKQIIRSYIADSNGFRILGNDLPISLETPAAAIVNAPALTAAVEGASPSIVEAALHPSKWQNTVDIRDLSLNTRTNHYWQQDAVFRQQQNLLQEQQRVIEQQQQQLQALQRNEKSTSSTVYQLRKLPRKAEKAKISQIQIVHQDLQDHNVITRESPYHFYYPYNYNYEFPAGFAYTGGVIIKEVPPPIGVQGTETENVIIAGHRGSSKPFQRPTVGAFRRMATHRRRLPANYKRPFVIGHAK